MGSNSSWYVHSWSRLKGFIGYKQPRNGATNSLAFQVSQRHNQNAVNGHAVLPIMSAPRAEETLGLRSSTQSELASRADERMQSEIANEPAHEEPMETEDARATESDQPFTSTPIRAINGMSIAIKGKKDKSMIRKVFGKKAMKNKKPKSLELKKSYDLQGKASYRLLLQHFTGFPTTPLAYRHTETAFRSPVTVSRKDSPKDDDIEEVEPSVAEFENFVSSKIPNFQTRQLAIKPFKFAMPSPKSPAVVSRPLHEKSFTQMKYTISQKKDEDNRKKIEERRRENEQKMSRATPLRLAPSELPESSRKLKEDLSKHQKYLQPDFVKNLTSDVDTGKEQKVLRLRECESKIQETTQKRQEALTVYRKTSSVAVVETRSPVCASYYRGMYPVEPEPEEEESSDEEEDIERPPLEEIEEYNHSRLSRVSNHEVLVEAFDIPIKKTDLETLSDLNWLNDEVINFYFNLIKKRADETDNLPKVHIFNTFFYTKLSGSANAYQTLKRWTRKVDLFSFNYLLIPVHLGMHWTLIGVNCDKKRIMFYDSMGGGPANKGGSHHLAHVLDYLRKEHLDKKKSPLPDEWQANKEGLGDDDEEFMIPQQMNGSDCGMFTCKYAEYISRNQQFRFSQDNMPYFRKKMVYEILKAEIFS